MKIFLLIPAIILYFILMPLYRLIIVLTKKDKLRMARENHTQSYWVTPKRQDYLSMDKE